MALSRREGVLIAVAIVGVAAAATVVLRDRAPAPDVAAQAPSFDAARTARSTGPSANALAAELDSLRAAFELEMERREVLEREVAALREALSSGSPIDDRRDAASADETSDDDAKEDGAALAAAGNAASPPGGAPPPSFDRDGLRAAGIREADVEALYERWTQLELDKLYLADEARRDGWAATRRYRRERRALQDAIRGELDEEGWDQWLYATGQNNRVVVGDVLDASPGERAGLLPGDQIVRYAGERVHTVRDVRSVTAQGVAGERVGVDVLRGGQLRTIGIERGPIGVILKEQRGQPGAG